MTLSRSTIIDLLATTRAERQQGFIVDQNGRKSTIDTDKFDLVIETMEEALRLKSMH